MILPPPLPPGGTVGVVAPASPFHRRSDVLRGLRWWRDRGFEVLCAPHLFARDAYTAGDPRARADDLMAMFADPDVHAVQCLRGGWGSTEVVPHLDHDVIRANPKPFVGKSDITSLHAALGRRAGLVTFWGAGLREVSAPDATAFTQQALLRALTSAEPLGALPAAPGDGFVRTFGHGSATGPLVGGTLWTLVMTLGTPWEPAFEGRVLFLEDVDLAVWEVDGLLTHLAQVGVLGRVAGVLLGEFVRSDWPAARHDHPRTPSLEDVLERHFEELGVPVLYPVPVGHGAHAATIPLGVEVTVDADAGTAWFAAPATRP